MAIERRVTELAGPVGGKLHTARSRNDQVATDVAMFVRAHAHETGGAIARLWRDAGRAGRGAPRLADARLHAPAARAAGLPRPPPAGLLLDADPRRAPLRRRRRGDRQAAARRGRAGRRQLRHRSRAWSPPSSGSPASPRTRSTRSPTATSCSTTWRRRPPAPRTSRGSAPRSCCGRARSSASARSPTRGPRARRSCPRRRTPTRPSCCAPRRRGSPATWSRCTACMHGLPLTYNKDMQEDKEHLFDAVDTLELCLAAADGHARPRSASGASAWPPPRATSCSPPPTSPTCSCAAACRSASRTGSSPGWCGTAVDQGKALSRADRARSSRRTRELLDDEFYAVLSDGAWLESKVSEGGTAWPGCASSSSRRATRLAPLRPRESAALLRPPGRRGRPRADRLRGHATARPPA